MWDTVRPPRGVSDKRIGQEKTQLTEKIMEKSTEVPESRGSIISVK